MYNKRIRQDGIDDVAVAYRTDSRANNIELANQAFSFIRKQTSCYVMIGDFTGFFDHLDHQYLKTQWCSLLGVERLPKDQFSVYKNVTQYSKFELRDLLRLNNLRNTSSGRHALNKKKRVLTPKQFQENKSHITKNKEVFGIPQGSPISALLANVYMLEVDKKINDCVGHLNGLYMRYSDDFIIILPHVTEIDVSKNFSMIVDIFNKTRGLTLEPEKTQFFSFEQNALQNCGVQFYEGADCKHRFINFLGFTFDGCKVSIRAKTTSKYYYRMRRKAKTILYNGGYSKNDKHISCHHLYELYSTRGAHGKKGNFLTYVQRAEQTFGSDELIGRDTKRHMQKIRKALEKERTKKAKNPANTPRGVAAGKEQ